jgi:hypothetical protein
MSKSLAWKVRDQMRCIYSLRTKVLCQWIKRFILFHGSAIPPKWVSRNHRFSDIPRSKKNVGVTQNWRCLQSCSL